MASNRAVPPPGRRPRIGRLQLFGIVDEVGHQFSRSVEAHHHGLVVAVVDDALDERDRGLLLELEAFADAVAGIDQDAEAQGQVGFGGELRDGLGLLVFEHLEVVLRQVGDEAALLVGDREEHVDAGNIQNDARARDRRGSRASARRAQPPVAPRQRRSTGPSPSGKRRLSFGLIITVPSMPSDRRVVETRFRPASPVNGCWKPDAMSVQKEALCAGSDSAAGAP